MELLVSRICPNHHQVQGYGLGYRGMVYNIKELEKTGVSNDNSGGRVVRVLVLVVERSAFCH